MTEEQVGPLVVGTLSVVVGLSVLVARARALRREVGRFLDAPASPIGALREGAIARIRGLPVALETFYDTGSARRCVAHNWLAVEQVRNVHGERQRFHVAGGEATPFLLDDGSGRVLVRAPLASITFGYDRDDEPSTAARQGGPAFVATTALFVDEPVLVIGTPRRSAEAEVHGAAFELAPEDEETGEGLVVTGRTEAGLRRQLARPAAVTGLLGVATLLFGAILLAVAVAGG